MRLIGLAVVLALTIVPFVVDAQEQRDEPKVYRIGPEDQLLISVWKNEAMSRSVLVRPDGKITLPLLNDVQAAGLTTLELRDVLIERFREFIPSPEVSVIVTDVRSLKMSVIGSTEDGQIGTIEKEIKAFQPFFVEHEPPRILTEGDEISLPVVVRNYLDHSQNVNLQIKPESWFALLGPATKSLNVAAGDATRGTFDFRASAAVKDGKQRITATAAADSDAMPHGSVFSQSSYFVRFWLRFTADVSGNLTVFNMASRGFFTTAAWDRATNASATTPCTPPGCRGSSGNGVNLTMLGVDGILPDSAFGVKEPIPRWPFYLLIAFAVFFLILAFLFWTEENPGTFPRIDVWWARSRGRAARTIALLRRRRRPKA